MNDSLICRSVELQAALRKGRPELFQPEEFGRSTIPSPKLVSLIYIVPDGTAPRAEAPRVIQNAGLHLRGWLSTELSGKSFRLPKPAVITAKPSRTADWFRTERNGNDPALYFWLNVEKVMKAMGYGGFNDPDHRWIYYIEAAPAPGQLVGGAAGVALLPLTDVDGLLGKSSEPVCRWVGGLGHELGHALGLPHPPGCDSGNARDPRECDSLMHLGYRTYPKTFLVQADHHRLKQSPFISSFTGGPGRDCKDLHWIAPAPSPAT